jgi:hypothetical protein
MDAGTYPAPLIVRRDGSPLTSATTLRPAGANVLVITTAITDRTLPLTLESTFVSAPRCRTHATIRRHGPTDADAEILTKQFDDATPPEAAMVVHRPEQCGYEHAQQLIEWGSALGQKLDVQVGDAFAERLQTL